MNFTEIERVIVDLGILGQLKRNAKISLYDPGYLSIQDHIPMITPLMRWVYGDKKENSVPRIKSLLDSTEKFLDNDKLEQRYRKQLLAQLRKAHDGLLNLGFTYSDYTKTFEQINLMLAQIDTILDKHRETFSPSPEKPQSLIRPIGRSNSSPVEEPSPPIISPASSRTYTSKPFTSSPHSSSQDQDQYSDME